LVWTQRIGSVIHQPRIFAAPPALDASTGAAPIKPAAAS
jgi:hypothetical protein